jgi:dihydroorotate dehydrogenase
MLNAVGLANPGLDTILELNKWQKRTDVFQISVMLVRPTQEEKIIEAHAICLLLNKKMPFGEKHRYAIQLNCSCPNTGHKQEQDANDTKEILKVFKTEMPNVPLIPKFDLRVEPATIAALKDYCDAFCIANAVPFGEMRNQVFWYQLFENGRSPLVKHFGENFKGGLSGAPLFPVLEAWLAKMTEFDADVSIIAGGGIMASCDIKALMQYKVVKGVALGTVAILRPWRLHGLMKAGNAGFQYFR